MAFRRTSTARGPRILTRSNLQRRNLMNMGLLTGTALIGSLAAALWVRMVLF